MVSCQCLPVESWPTGWSARLSIRLKKQFAKCCQISRNRRLGTDGSFTYLALFAVRCLVTSWFRLEFVTSHGEWRFVMSHLQSNMLYKVLLLPKFPSTTKFSVNDIDCCWQRAIELSKPALWNPNHALPVTRSKKILYINIFLNISENIVYTLFPCYQKL